MTVSEEGSISITALACVFMALLLCLGVVDAGLYLAARFAAQNAADAAALAAVQESFPLITTGRAAEEAAGLMARANGAVLEECRVSPGGEKVTVAVSVEPECMLLGKLGLSTGPARARAAAEVDLEAMLARGVIWGAGIPPPGFLPTVLERCRDSAGASTLVPLLALSHLGKPYSWGAAGPGRFDCSGLVFYVFGQLGIRLPRVTFDQVRCGKAVSPGELAPGDLVFFRANAHVGIYMGGGWFIHAPRTGESVRLQTLGSRSDLSACRRLF